MIFLQAIIVLCIGYAPGGFVDKCVRVRLCLLLASELKRAGLPWKPHVGCFLWDRDALIEASSPFPNRIYFILNLEHFLGRFETSEKIAEKLGWLPT